MKHISSLLLVVTIFANIYGQGITGKWLGELKIHGTNLPIVFNIDTTQQGLKATMDSPKQEAYGIEVASILFDNNKLKISMPKLMLDYEGKLIHADTVSGVFVQAAMPLQLKLVRLKDDLQLVKRPQEPSVPYPYIAEDVQFVNKKANITLAGTFTYPEGKGKFPTVVLITGSGPQNRDEELLGHKPFLVLSDYLTRKGIAVLRFDDRGFGKSTGDFASATSTDFATDVEAAINYILTRKEVDKKKIGLVGHSEGGNIAPMVAKNSKHVKFIVLMAGTGIPGSELLLLQQELIVRGMGITEEEMQKSKKLNEAIFRLVHAMSDTDELKNELASLVLEFVRENPQMANLQNMSEVEIVNTVLKQYASPWMINFIKHNPATDLEKVKCAVLAINGEKDLQVPADKNLNAIQAALDRGGNTSYDIRKLAGLNHLFQECKTGLPQEYGQIEQTISPIALNLIGSWIQKKVAK